MRRWLLAVLFSFPSPALSVSEALALSCMPPTAESVFSHHQDSSGIYVMAVGRISLAAPLPTFNPQTLQHEPPGLIEAKFKGRLARGTGFDLPITLPISIERNCFDDICGFLPIRSPAVLFLEAGKDGHVLHTDYCSSTLLPEPTGADLDRLIVCLNEGACAPVD